MPKFAGDEIGRVSADDDSKIKGGKQQNIYEVVEDINTRTEKKERVKKEWKKRSYEGFCDFSLHFFFLKSVTDV